MADTISLMTFTKKLFIVFCFSLLSLLSVFIFRNAILDYALKKTGSVLLQRYGLHMHASDAGFTGIRNVYIKDLSLVPPGRDTLLYIKNGDVQLSISHLLRLRLAFNELYADTVLLNAVKYDSLHSNFEFIIKRKSDGNREKQTGEPRQFNDLLSSLLRKMNTVLNENVVMKSVRMVYHADGRSEQISIPELLYDRKVIKASVITASLDGVSSYVVRGTMNTGNTEYAIRVVRNSGEKTALPFFDRFDNFRISFDTLSATLSGDPGGREVPLNATLRFKDLVVNHWRISPVDVTFPDLELDLNSHAGKHRFTLREGTGMRLSSLPVSLQGYYEQAPQKKFTVHTSFNCDAEDFFSSLPSGMFNTLQGFSATGKMKFDMQATLNFSEPDSVKFTSSLQKENFRIKRFGVEYFPLINGDFQFTAMDRSVPVRKIIVGQENPMYAALGEISDHLKFSVLTSEDPSFMTHNGFVEQSFRESIAKNLREKRFARGGSTISMQLVKNLFLSRNKTIARKLEEALIVWIIEQNNLVSKERMLEVYLNIIEWGPNVYGIGEASRFYFDKLPSEITLEESIFLASIIPHPKYFKYMFDSTGTLKENQKGYYNLIASRMLKRNQIAQAEFDALNPAVQLKGEALNLILPAAVMPAEEDEDD